ncbi:DnaJ (Hsp40), subfamily C, member 17 [Halocaridina rubra]|uniref:DnaJ (Hsp40), subfamily C, member 17 n=1 Tax=Halocaridina rubra TaxID=373956 RepID=A0AAN9ADP2_HALRR
MSKKRDMELMKLDFYDILGISTSAGEKEVKKAYRKKALKCHPDKNPDNPDAAKEFDRLKKILEILLDSGARSAYDKLLKSRKAAAIRARESDAKSQKLKSQLEERERQAQARPQISEEERLRRELKRLEDEGQLIVEDELEKLNKEVAEELRRESKLAENSNGESSKSLGNKIKVRWLINEKSSGYTEDEIRQLFYKWGEISALVMKQKSKKGTALIEYKDKSGADMAVQFEKGQMGKPVEVTHITETPKESKKTPPAKTEPAKQKSGYDYESIADMNRRRLEERQRLIQEILAEESAK